MKKLILAGLCAVAFVLSGISVCAEDMVVESPDIKIIIDGKLSTYSDVPITVNNRTLLPFREVLNNRGVQNDDKHIIWNSKEKSVTIYKDEIEVYLKIDSTDAMVNNEPVTIDVAPMIYKNRTYIPTRFISQSLGIKVGWDPIASTVLLKNESDYNSAKDILERTFTAMNSLERYKTSESGKASVFTGKITILSITQDNTMYDFKNKLIYSTVDSSLEDGENKVDERLEYFTDGFTEYVRSDGAWSGSPIELDKRKELFAFEDLLADDVLCSGLNYESDSTGSYISLKGNIDLKNYSDGYFELVDIKDYRFKNVDVEILIDKETYYLNKISLKATVLVQNNEDSEINTELETLYSDFNGNFEVPIPEGLAVG
jgi:hypothetical protein